ncbi:hypothetical protein [Sporomusa termitida]|uniref:Uncharacterized protein n=1 Tax=Sporomusa termitida TaxID=2377 RepID=A0A517DVK3_9FIRM|nr:hypothetical protein [Sporomusa termitida]QDR81357.1 hypothetical protein SPTER_27360 [Sporomusa termitida]
MKATVYKGTFLSHALPIIAFDRISIAAFEGILSVASFGTAENFRITAYIVEPSQAYLTAEEWRNLVLKVQASPDKLVDIVF